MMNNESIAHEDDIPNYHAFLFEFEHFMFVTLHIKQRGPAWHMPLVRTLDGTYLRFISSLKAEASSAAAPSSRPNG